ncbi:alpha/beta-hydrolase [Lentinus tigrinus ALCF2SS1-7]|uniref:Alpha/beta-hydrolase n=1 Tax=Lentinus tigrinus ALCF2SS1-6 TaxID=1328759 RepID=A0A5C2SN22_9APHY|nr:alpha/beta-hydrolase [Lentinus tigrinus ALCF2SS1-6]RPD79421.1 alpha/beta-hydrolase [Lentinus tigrinus ALCF2SS1-7]
MSSWDTPASKLGLVVAGIPLDVYSCANATKPETLVAVMFLLHGRMGSARKMEDYVHGIFKEVQERRRALPQGAREAQDLYIVTFDHRNHGKRMENKKANMGWFDDPEKNNERHAIDMYAIQTGTAQDVSYLIDFLPSYMFPNGERHISQWICAGKSLGGHSTWIVLRNDPRVKLGIPIIGCPDYLTLISKRAKAHKLPAGPPYIPDSLLALIKRTDPAASPYTVLDDSNPFLGKKILVLAGKDDKTVPWSAGKTFVETLNVGQRGVKEVIIEEGVGHEFSEAMVKEVAHFVWQHALLQ